MKRNGHSKAYLAPDATGWRLRVSGLEDKSLPTLDEAVAAVPAGARVELALPCQSVLLERHRLPATDRTEIADMLQLQLEKTLPFPMDEVSHGFDVINQGESESTILAVAAHHAQLDQICAPLRDQGRLPERITLNAMKMAAACPAGETALAIWQEQEQLVVALVTEGKLAWAQTISSVDPETVSTDLPGLLIGAELDGASADFDRIRLSPECGHLAPTLASQFERPVEPLVESENGGALLDLLPPSWQHDARKRERGERLKQNLLMAAVAYLLVVAGAFVYLAWLKKTQSKERTRYAQMQPAFVPIEKQKARWQALSPAAFPPKFGMEVLHQLTKNVGVDDKLHFTSFTFRPDRWALSGEGTSDAYFYFSQRLKKDPDISEWEISTPPAAPLKDSDVKFDISGKVRQ